MTSLNEQEKKVLALKYAALSARAAREDNDTALAELKDIEQQLQMTPEEILNKALELNSA